MFVFGCNAKSSCRGSWRVLRSQRQRPLADVEEDDETTETVDVDAFDDGGWGASFGEGCGWNEEEEEEESAHDEDVVVRKEETAPVSARDETAVADSTAFDLAEALSVVPLDVIEEPYERSDVSDIDSIAEEYAKKFNLSASGGSLNEDGATGGGRGGESFEAVPRDQRYFLRFQRRLARRPDQCFRYAYGGSPLWDNVRPDNLVVPKCRGCGLERLFEFQLTPQVLHLLRVESTSDDPMDWGGVYVYSCPMSCEASNEEFVFVTDAN